MENRNEPLKFKEWMLKEYPTNQCFQQPPVELLATECADYIKSFQPAIEPMDWDKLSQKFYEWKDGYSPSDDEIIKWFKKNIPQPKR